MSGNLLPVNDRWLLYAVCVCPGLLLIGTLRYHLCPVWEVVEQVLLVPYGASQSPTQPQFYIQ